MKKVLSRFILIFVISIISIINVKALSNASVSYVIEDVSENVYSVYIKAEADFNKGTEHVLRYAYFTKENTGSVATPTNLVDAGNAVCGGKEYLDCWKYIDTETGSITELSSEIYIRGAKYAYVMECDSTSCDKSDIVEISSIPELPDMDERYRFYMFDDELSVYTEFFGPTTLNLNFKIGKLEDKDVINSYIENGNTDKLLNYAKNDTGTNFYIDHTTPRASLKDYSIEECQYYYAYVTIDDPNNEFIKVDGIHLIFGIKDTSGKIFLDNYDKEYYAKKCGISLNTNTTQNPKTGINNTLYITTGAILISGTLIFIKLKKRKNNEI